ncbi:MAG: DUF115 domain-containing protein [Clostridiales bacterium]|jgi:hypothetical protein|nr:DUF115 domain-containing protein [Clostridiales bacterium]
MPTAEILPAKNGENTLILTINGKKTYIHSAYDPGAEGRRLAAELNAPEDAEVVAFGRGLGYHLAALAPRPVVAVEPSEEIAAICGGGALPLSDGLTEAIRRGLTKPAVVFVHPVYRRLFPEACARFLWAAKEAFAARIVDSNTLSALAETWQGAMYANLRRIARSESIAALRGVFAGRTAVICGAGPSLNEDLDAVRAGTRATVICAYTALPALRAAGIAPAFVVSVDANQCAKGDALLAPGRQPEPVPETLLWSETTDPRLLARHTGKSYFMCSSPFVRDTLVRAGLTAAGVEHGPSVICAALSAARYMGFSSIIFAGMDLCVSETRTHAAGTVYDAGAERSAEKIRENGLRVRVKGGGTAFTTPAMLSFKVWIERFIRQNSKIVFCNLTARGAEIEGAEDISAMAAAPGEQPDTMDIFYSADEDKALIFEGYVRDALSRLAALRPIAERALEICGVDPDARAMVQLARIDREIRANRAAVEAAVYMFERRWREGESSSGKMAKSRAFYGAVAECAKFAELSEFRKKER